MTKTEFVIGKTLPYVIISLFEFFFIHFLGALTFDIPVPQSSYPYLFLLAFTSLSIWHFKRQLT